MVNTVKMKGVNPDVIKLQLFTFSESLPYGSVKNLEEMAEAYLNKLFPPTLTSER